MLARVQVEHEVHQRPLQLRAQIPVDGEARPGQFHRAFQIKNAEFGAQVPVRFGSELKLSGCAPAANFDILLGALANRHARVRQVGKARENIVQPRIEIRGSFFQRLNLLSQVLGLGHCGAGVLAALLQFCDLFRSFVAPGFAGFSLGDGLPALRVNFAKIFQHGSRVQAALPQLFFHQGQIAANEIQIKHGNSNVSEKCRRMHVYPRAKPPASRRRSHPERSRLSGEGKDLARRPATLHARSSPG